MERTTPRAFNDGARRSSTKTVGVMSRVSSPSCGEHVHDVTEGLVAHFLVEELYEGGGGGGVCVVGAFGECA